MQSEKSLESRKYVADGDKLILKTEVANQELSAKDVVGICDSMRTQIETGEQQKKQITQSYEQLPKLEGQLEKAKAELSKLEKHESRMLSMQESRAKVLYELYAEAAIKEIDESYVWDKSLPYSTNILQKYQQLQRKISTTPRVADELAPSVIQKMFYKECFFDNPWADKAEQILKGVTDGSGKK